MMLIGLAGQAGGGKSTVANYLTEVRDYREVSLDEPIRAGLQAMLEKAFRGRHDRPQSQETVIPLARPLAAPAHATLGTEWDVGVCMAICGSNSLTAWSITSVAMPRARASRASSYPTCAFDNEAEWLRGIGGQVWHLYPTNSPAHELPSGWRIPVNRASRDWDSDAGLINEFGSLDRLHRSIDGISCAYWGSSVYGKMDRAGDALLRERYRRPLPTCFCDLLPYRSRDNIYQHASRIGLRKDPAWLKRHHAPDSARSRARQQNTAQWQPGMVPTTRASPSTPAAAQSTPTSARATCR